MNYRYLIFTFTFCFGFLSVASTYACDNGTPAPTYTGSDGSTYVSGAQSPCATGYVNTSNPNQSSGENYSRSVFMANLYRAAEDDAKKKKCEQKQNDKKKAVEDCNYDGNKVITDAAYTCRDKPTKTTKELSPSFSYGGSGSGVSISVGAGGKVTEEYSPYQNCVEAENSRGKSMLLECPRLESRLSDELKNLGCN